MDQMMIGRFIAELRKEKNMTQANLAEEVGVSDKTISKWECGRGIPDIANMKQLCQVFDISINEMISGERIVEDIYEQKVENVIYNLIEEVEKDKKRKVYHILYPILSVLAVVTLIEVTMLISAVQLDDIFSYMIDVPSIIAMLITTVIFLMITGMIPDLLHGITYVMGKEWEKYNDLRKSSIVVTLTQRTLLTSGILVTLIQLITLLYLQQSTRNIVENMSVTIISTIYGIIGYLILLPIKIKLEVFIVDGEKEDKNK